LREMMLEPNSLFKRRSTDVIAEQQFSYFR